MVLPSGIQLFSCHVKTNLTQQSLHQVEAKSLVIPTAFLQSHCPLIVIDIVIIIVFVTINIIVTISSPK